MIIYDDVRNGNQGASTLTLCNLVIERARMMKLDGVPVKYNARKLVDSVRLC